MRWQLQDAKNRFSEVVRRARSEGPQTVTLHGEEAAVVVSAEDYARMRKSKPSIVETLLSGPAWDDELARDVTRRARKPSRKTVAL